ncbi:MAG: pyridoxal 5'-phosphate synthase lyase subunit PdxS [Staphylococcus epidermidis]|nr:pyridoxal 5'-phosphate synthase lyase subunit PdxS [Staphylococcus epidermidis]
MSKIVGSDRVKRGMAEMQKGGVIMDVVNAEQAKIAEEAGAVAVMALERVPSDIRAAGGVARMANPKIVEEVMNAVSIPVMAKARIGHITEARVLESMGVDYIDESEVLTPADEEYHLRKDQFTVPFVCGCRNLGEAARRIGEYEVLKQIKDNGRLPVVNFAAGGVATPQDAALMMELGADGVFVGSGIFKSEDPEKFAKAIVQATTHYQDYELIGKLASELGTAMKGLDINQISLEERMQERGW